MVGPNGVFSIANIPRDAYTLHIKGAKYLATNVTVNASNGNVTGVTAFLRAGDVDNNNAVDLDDLGLLALAFNTVSGASFYDARADLDGNNAVDLDDLGLLARNFNVSGDP